MEWSRQGRNFAICTLLMHAQLEKTRREVTECERVERVEVRKDVSTWDQMSEKSHKYLVCYHEKPQHCPPGNRLVLPQILRIEGVTRKKENERKRQREREDRKFRLSQYLC